jgi:hypothetical protein
MTFAPFENESDAMEIGDLKIENRSDHIAIYGTLAVTRDKKGLEQARQMKTLIETVVRALEAKDNLPDQVAPPLKPKTVKNPFQA